MIGERVPVPTELPDGYELQELGTSAVRLVVSGTPLVAVKLPKTTLDPRGRTRVRESLARAARARERMQQLRSESIVAARTGSLAEERELIEAACHARETYDVCIANALGRYSK